MPAFLRTIFTHPAESRVEFPYEVLKDSVTVDFDLSPTMKKTSLDTHRDMLSHINRCPEDLL